MANPEDPRRTAQKRLRQIRAEIAALDYICSGTLSHKTKRCGKPSCACQTNPDARHGPYYEWHRREDSRQVHSMLPNDVGEAFLKAAENYRRLKELMREWERESARALLAHSKDRHTD